MVRIGRNFAWLLTLEDSLNERMKFGKNNHILFLFASHSQPLVKQNDVHIRNIKIHMYKIQPK